MVWKVSPLLTLDTETPHASRCLPVETPASLPVLGRAKETNAGRSRVYTRAPLVSFLIVCQRKETSFAAVTVTLSTAFY